MDYLGRCCCHAVALLAVVATLSTSPIQANDITTEWATVKPPPGTRT
jgi:hypothetical protein